MASFELGKEIDKYVFSSCNEHGKKKTILSSHEESYINFVLAMLTTESLWLSGRALDRARNAKVWGLIPRVD